MALIYSRPRIKFPKLYMFHKKTNQKNNKIKLFITGMILFIILILSMIKAVAPIFNELCRDKAKSVATIICNQQTTQCLNGYGYSDFVVIHTDADKNIVMLESNVVNINKVISNIAEQIQLQINSIENEDISISLGSFTGISLLAGRGPQIPIRISTIGNVITDFKSEFIEKGINQTVHRLYLEIECEISILTPFNTINEKIVNQFIVAENVIVGNIPDAYYNIEGVTTNEALEVVE